MGRRRGWTVDLLLACVAPIKSIRLQWNLDIIGPHLQRDYTIRHTAALVAIASLIAIACARTSRTSNQPRVSTSVAQRDTTCDFVPVMEHPNPTILADEFVKRASRAEFAHTEKWMPAAVSCVGHEPGYDTFEIVDSFTLTALDSTLHLKRMILRRVIIGDYSNGRFSPHRRVGIDTLLIESTQFGWRIQNPVWNWITLDVANQRKWLADTARGKA